eukprot:TRINITY_DN1122_c0_g1_i2.p1 TRINITY_DN1122_c0_g1~~TRINITY_DN1122_c0_g1_i2.p1  ORF type:complete len:150 (+),score=34.96 TRINITY_DN1122_c0_g1_i2:173-622(+)
MFEGVALNWPPFRESLVLMDRAMAKIDPNNSASAMLYPREPYESEQSLDETLLANTRFAQPTTVASSLGCFDIFTQAGFYPDFVAGHSLGELTALHISGAFDRDVLYELVCHRAVAMASSETKEARAMVAVIGKGASGRSSETAKAHRG